MLLDDKLHDILDGLDVATATGNDVKSKIDKVLVVTKNTKVPPSIKHLIMDSLACYVWQGNEYIC